MKKIMLVSSMAIVVLFLTSCLKTRVCECRSTSTPTANQNFVYEMSDKIEAEANCENEQIIGRATIASDYTCTLK